MHPHPTASPTPRGVRSVLAALLLTGLGCGLGAARAPDADWPAGALLSARRAPLLSMLGALESLDGTPAARLARELRAKLPDCEEIEARAPDAASLPQAIRCADRSGALRGLHEYRGDRALALALPLEAGPRMLMRIADREGTLHVDLRWPDSAAHGLVASLLPGKGDAGRAVLADEDRILHARVRSDSLDLAALVPEGSQAEDLFRLKSELLSSAVLDGSWEIALYAPLAGHPMPRVAAALGVRMHSAAQAAMQHLLQDVEARWSLVPTPLHWKGAEGACLMQVRLLPELAPCVAETDRALVLAWNQESLRHALGSAGRAATAPPGAARAELDLEGLRAADLRLAALQRGSALAQVTRWPWSRVVARGGRRGGSVALEIDLLPAREQGS